MVSLNGFNADEVDPVGDFSPLPDGRYTAVITESEEKTTNAGNGTYLQLTMEVIEGEHKGRKVWACLNLNNPSAKAVQIARGQLSAICRAVGVMKPQDSSQLHNLPLEVSVGSEVRPDTGAIVNKVKGFGKVTPAAGQRAQAATSTPPWQRR